MKKGAALDPARNIAMSRSKWCRWLLAGALVAGCLCIAPRPAGAVEEARRFLEALRDPEGRFRYYDTALEYLEIIRNSPLVDQEFKDVIDYEAGVTLVTTSRMVGDTAVQQKQLDQAEQKFKKFLADHPKHPLVSSANTQLANLLVERGRVKSEQAARPSASEAEKKRLPAEARELYDEAQKVLAKLEKELLEELRKLKPIVPRDKETEEKLKEVQRDLLQVRLALVQVIEEAAETYPPGSKGNTDNLKAAAKKYNELYEKYDTYIAGHYARMWEGRCYKDLGETDKAFDAFEDLLVQPSEIQPFRLLKSKALILLLETALLPEVKQYKKALDEAQQWEKEARGAEESNPEGLAIKYLAGEAALEYANTLEGKKNEAARKKALASAKQLFDFVAGFSGEYQKKARDAARRPEFVGEDFVVPEPTNFAEARDRATDTLFLSADKHLKPEEAAKARAEAIEYFRMAIRMKTADVTPDEMNVIRYRLAYLYYKCDELYQAAVIGEFLARRYPNGTGARQGARIALAAYVKLFNAAEPEQRQFEAERMVDIAEYITRLWQGERLAAEAWMTLIRTALGDDDFDKAQEYLQKVPADSPRRGEIELTTGQRLWASYLQASRKEEAQRPSQEVLDKMVEQAQKTLEDGIARMRKSVDQGGEVSPTLAAAVLSLAQIYIGAAEPEKAVGRLEDPKIGALTLVTADHPAAGDGQFRVETYKAALRAYVSVQEVDKAREVMRRLENLTKEGGDAEAGKKLTRIYISLGRELQEQLERLRNQQKTDQLAKVSEAFRDFLDRIRQGEGNTFSSLNWVAETFFSLGAGFDPGGKTLSPEAKGYYEKAADTYQRILQRCDDADFGAPQGAATSIKIRLAKCLRRLGPSDQRKYDKAMALLVEILRDRGTMIDAQVEAAYVYQARGEQDARYYPFAISGGKRFKGSKVNLVWGWGKIALRAARDPKYESIFHEARYGLAYCRFEMAKSKRNKKEQDELFKKAETDIRVVYRLYPKMGQGLYLEPGGKDWREKYDDLLKKIQKVLGKNADGLKGMEASRATAARTG
jgi:tetratricopeptide (TPR) repeat protein